MKERFVARDLSSPRQAPQVEGHARRVNRQSKMFKSRDVRSLGWCAQLFGPSDNDVQIAAPKNCMFPVWNAPTR